MFWIRIMAVVLGITLAQSAYGGTIVYPDVKCHEGNCHCNVQIAEALAGRNVNWDIVNKYSGSNDPEQVFKSPGSENISVTCRAVKYLKDNNPTWFEGYFGVQLNDPHVGHSGREMFSATYMSITVGNIVAVLNHAIKKGHGPLVAGASGWLKTYWAMLALGARYHKPKFESHHRQGTRHDRGEYKFPGNTLGGVVPSTRSYVNARGGVGFNFLQLSIALQKSGTTYTGGLNGSPGFYGGLRSMIASLGYHVPSSGRVDLRSRSVAPERIGLTAQERKDLMGFITSRGSQSFTEVVDLITTHKFMCHMSARRTANGIAIWWGDSSGNRTKACHRGKGGPILAVTFDFEANETHFLSASTQENHPEAQDVWREGNKLCADSVMLPKQCINIPGGELKWEIYFKKKRIGFECVEGDCDGGSEPPPPPPPPPPPDPNNPDTESLPYGSEGKIVDILYETFLYRKAETGGRNYWIGVLKNSGTYHGTWGEAYRLSEEFMNIAKSNGIFGAHSKEEHIHRWYKSYLRRCADPGGLSYWGGVYDSQGPNEALKQIFTHFKGMSVQKAAVANEGPPNDYTCK